MNIKDLSIAQMDLYLKQAADRYSVATNWAVFSGEVQAYFYDLSSDREDKHMTCAPLSEHMIQNDYDGDVEKAISKVIGGFLEMEYRNPRVIFSQNLPTREKYFKRLDRHFLNRGWTKEESYENTYKVKKDFGTAFEVRFEDGFFDIADNKVTFDKTIHAILQKQKEGVIRMNIRKGTK